MNTHLVGNRSLGHVIAHVSASQRAAVLMYPAQAA
jgi:hypothetical protein